MAPDNQEEFKAVVLGSELSLNQAAVHFGVGRKLKWEEPLVLKEEQLHGIVREPGGKRAYFFHFGAAVFVNLAHHEINDVLVYLRRLDAGMPAPQAFEYADDYLLAADSGGEPAVGNDAAVFPSVTDHHREVVATVLAKSVAMERIEAQINRLLDELEEIIEYLRKGRLTMSDKRLAKMSARILGFKLGAISSIMLFDKPEITWDDAAAATLYDQMAALFELEDRYRGIRHKSETLMDITEVFSGLAHATRGTRLEWTIIILIVIEIVLSLLQKS